jgi:hypothetical protein
MSRPVTDSECLPWGRSYFAAHLADKGVFGCSQMKRSAGKKGPRFTSLIEHCDTSHLVEKALGAIEAGTAIIVDGTSSSLKFPRDGKGNQRTVSVFVEQVGYSPLISLGRRDEKLSDPGASLALEMLKEARSLLADDHEGLLTAPLISFDPELNTQHGRKDLHRDGVSYAIRVNAGERFYPPPWSADDPLDLLKSNSAENIFDIYHRLRDDADPATPACVALNDLPEGRFGALRPALVEYLCRFPTASRTEYFLARVWQPPGTPPIVLKRGAMKLALRAAKYLGATPGEALRLHEFHHLSVDPYCATVRIADRCLYLEANLGKDADVS